MLIDTHIHLDAAEFDSDREDLIAAARAAGVARFVVPGVEVKGFPRIAALAAAHPEVHCAWGIHPLYVGHAAPDDLDRLEAQLARGDAIAVGEIGLDHYVPCVDAALQERYYVAQLKLARRFDLPVILHVRRAVDQILKQLRRVEVPGGIAHAFNGSRQQADTLLAMGFRLGFGGAMSYDGSRRIRALAASLPIDAIVLETDAPDMAPAWGAGERNVPANLPRLAEVLARLRCMSSVEVGAATARNAREVFGRRMDA